MPQDYAKNKLAPKKRPRKRRIPLFVLFILLIILSGIASFAYFYPAKLSKENVLYLIAYLKNHSPSNPPENNQQKKEEKDKNEIHFSFYDELPKAQIKLSEAPPPSSKPNTAASKPNQNGIILQLGLFKDPARASETRLSLLLSGVATHIAKIQIENDTWYQVQQGPFASLNAAKAMQQKLLKKNINSDILNQTLQN